MDRRTARDIIGKITGTRPEEEEVEIEESNPGNFLVRFSGFEYEILEGTTPENATVWSPTGAIVPRDVAQKWGNELAKTEEEERKAEEEAETLVIRYNIFQEETFRYFLSLLAQERGYAGRPAYLLIYRRGDTPWVSTPGGEAKIPLREDTLVDGGYLVRRELWALVATQAMHMAGTMRRPPGAAHVAVTLANLLLHSTVEQKIKKMLGM